MKRFSWAALALIGMGFLGCEPAQLVIPGDGDADTDVDADSDVDTDIPYHAVGTTTGVYSEASVLYVTADILSAVDDCAALVGSYHGEVGDLHLYAHVEDSDLGWAVTTSATDRGFATTLRQDEEPDTVLFATGYEFPFAYDEMPTGVYRANLRTVLDCEALTGFENGLVSVGVSQLGDIDDEDAWGNLEDIDSNWVWCGVDEWGDEVCSIAANYDRASDVFSGAADELPADLGDLDN